MAITPQPRDLSPLAFAIDRIAQRFTNSTIIYGPNTPLAPIAQEQVPRRMQYPVGVNMVWQPRRDWPNLTPFDTLRYLTKRHPLAALCIRVRSQHVMGLSGRAVAKDKKAQAAEQGAADAVMQLLDRPDGTTPRAVWLQMLVRDLLEVDAPTIYKRPSRDGGLSQLEVVDGATIKPILNDRGRVIAYQQVIYGVALSQYLGRRVGLDEELAVGEYAPGELWYQPFNAAVTDPYGRAPMEDLIEMAKTYLRKIDSDLTRFTDGNIPAALGIVEGGGLSPDQVLTFEEDFNAHLQGLDSRGSRIKFVPFPVKVERLQELSTGGQYETAWEEHNVKMVCAAYGVTPAELGFLADVNRATADAAENTTFRIGIKPLALWLKTVLFNPIIQRDLGQTQLEWQWEGLEAADDTEKTARIDNIYGGLGVVSPDELRTMRYPDLEGKAPGQPQANPAAGVPMPQPAQKAVDPAPLAKAAPDEPPDEATRLTLITRLERVLAAALASQAGRVADALREAGAADAMRQALAALWPGEREALTRAVLPVLDEIVAAGLESGATALPFAADWGLVNEAALQLARERAAALAATATATTEAHVAQVVADWVATGGTLDDLVDRWQAVSGQTRRRAEVGAVTTVTDLYAQANRQAWAESGLVEGYEVTGTNDERVCPMCSAKHGEYPISDLDNLPPYHPRCRCWILPKLV